MSKYLITASVDGIGVDFEKEFKSDSKLDYYEIYNICMEHGCSFFFVDKLNDQGKIIESNVL